LWPCRSAFNPDSLNCCAHADSPEVPVVRAISARSRSNATGHRTTRSWNVVAPALCACPMRCFPRVSGDPAVVCASWGSRAAASRSQALVRREQLLAAIEVRARIADTDALERVDPGPSGVCRPEQEVQKSSRTRHSTAIRAFRLPYRPVF
jgi:hypothetical protein